MKTYPQAAPAPGTYADPKRTVGQTVFVVADSWVSQTTILAIWTPLVREANGEPAWGETRYACAGLAGLIPIADIFPTRSDACAEALRRARADGA